MRFLKKFNFKEIAHKNKTNNHKKTYLTKKELFASRSDKSPIMSSYGTVDVVQSTTEDLRSGH